MLYEIWIGEHYSHFDHGVAHLDDGRKIELKNWIHVATYGNDSVLIDDAEHFADCNFPLRWFTKPGALEFYHISSNTPDVLFHNESNVDIRIDCFGILKPGESMTVSFSK